MKTAALVFVVAILSACSSPLSAQSGAREPSKTVIAPRDEPGERIVVSGTVYGPDGVSAISGASVYVYHTDIRGYYSGETRDSSNPRLRGMMHTDAKGGYEFDTIKPGPYPSARIPAHIHYVVSAPGFKKRVFEIVFEGDPLITDAIRRSAARADSPYSIRLLEKDESGRLRCTQDVTLEAE